MEEDFLKAYNPDLPEDIKNDLVDFDGFNDSLYN